MKIKISELFKYRQYLDDSVYYCFDRKEYKICDSSNLNSQENEHYNRYIPLLQIDEKQIQEAYIESLNNRQISYKYKNSSLSFNAFIDYQNLHNDWWNYYRRTVFLLEKTWCEENSIQYAFDL